MLHAFLNPVYSLLTPLVAVITIYTGSASNGIFWQMRHHQNQAVFSKPSFLVGCFRSSATPV
ncbi:MULTISPECIES: hypothetical protein [unclassified Microcoleus]|uniref:hypothetical protein n=1 Tax=unclassified Microcoleus TaxID=2642155 RepID=UPI0025DB8E81|nr:MULTISPECIES: hypothetical protein [unclassified Microcoleus]